MNASDLVYPIYLDTSMMTGFLAALEGGIANDRTVTTTGTSSTEYQGSAEAGIKTGPLLTKLLEVGAKLTGSGKSSEGETMQESVVRRHTEVSLFIGLRSALLEMDLIHAVPNLTASYDQIERGSLVELTGTFQKNPVNQLVSLFMELKPLIDAMQQTAQPSTSSAKRQPKRAEKSEADMAIDLLEQIGKSLAGQPNEDLLMVPAGESDGGARAVVAANPAYAKNRDLVDVLEGEFTLLGKVSRKLAQAETIDLLRKSIFGRMADPIVQPMFESFKQTPDLKLDLSPLSVNYPAIQLIPLAIFV